MNALRIKVITIAMVLMALLSACDNGGTISPDAGCVGQGASFDSCAQMLEVK